MLSKLFTAHIIICLLSPHAVIAEELRIAVASNFYSTLKHLKPIYEREYTHKLTIIRGSTGKLTAQIIHGAPYDIFLAADKRRPEFLEKKELTSKNSRSTYAIGQVALWSAATAIEPLKTLKSGKFNKIAMANPKTAPYGEAAKQVLQSLNLYKRFKPKTVIGENISQAFQFIQSGNATLGFVAYPDIKRYKINNYWLPNPDSYSALEQQLVILKRSSKQNIAKTFTSFLQRHDIQKIINQQGYIVP